MDAPGDVTGAAIARANLNGRNIIADFIKPIDSVCGTMAIQGRHIYWNGAQGIGRANLDGTHVHLGFIPPVSAQDCGVAINSP